MIKLGSPFDSSKSLSVQDFEPTNESLSLTKIKTECKKSAKIIEMLSYSNKLSNEACNMILENLRQDREEVNNVEDSKKNPKFYSSTSNDKSHF